MFPNRSGCIVRQPEGKTGFYVGPSALWFFLLRPDLGRCPRLRYCAPLALGVPAFLQKFTQDNKSKYRGSEPSAQNDEQKRARTKTSKNKLRDAGILRFAQNDKRSGGPMKLSGRPIRFWSGRCLLSPFRRAGRVRGA